LIGHSTHSNALDPSIVPGGQGLAGGPVFMLPAKVVGDVESTVSVSLQCGLPAIEQFIEEKSLK
jgi:hypothetical protein